MGEKDFRVRKGLVVDGTGDSTIAGRLAIGGETGSNALRVVRNTTTAAAAHNEVAQLLVKPLGTNSQDALLKIIGARNGSTSANTATLVLANRDDNATGGGTQVQYGQLGAITGRVSDATNNIGDMHFITYADAQTPSDRMVIKSDGKVGIGTTSPDEIFHISSASHPAIRITGTDNANADPAIEMLGQNNNYNEGFQMWYDNGTGIGHISTLYDNDAADIRFHTKVAADRSTSNTRMTIAGDGNVGIGTVNPQSRLQISHTDQTTTVANTNELSHYSMLFKNNSVTADTFTGIAFDVSTETDQDSISASIIAQRDTTAGSTAGNHDANLIFSTNDGGDDGNYERMRITRGGRVGVAEDDPQSRLHITHNSTVGFSNENALTHYALFLKNNNVGTDDFVGIAFDVSTETDYDSIGASIAAVRDTSAGSSAGSHDTNLVFSTNDGGDDANTERMRIHHDGPIEFNGAYKFPTSDGAPNQVLRTNGSGTLSFATVTSGGGGATTLNGLTDVLISGGTSIIANNFGSAPTTGTISTASNNVVIGYLASDALTEGDDNIALGAFSLTELTTGSKNVAIGRHAGAGITTSVGGVHLGYFAGLYQTGSQNISIGHEALMGPNTGTVDGTGHVAIGVSAGAAMTTGNRNILIGFQAGDNLTTGSGNVIIGRVDASAVDVNDSLIIAGGDSDLSSSVTWLTGESNGNLTTNRTTTIGDGAGGTSMTLGNNRTILFGTGGDSTIAPMGVSGTDTTGKSLSIYGGNSTGTAAGGVIKFITAAAGGVSNSNLNTHLERMRIDADGKVGIGTTSPSDKLHLLGSDGGTSILVEDSDTNSNPAVEIKNDAVHWKLQARGGSSDKFQITEGSSTHVTIDTSGNVATASNLTVGGNLIVSGDSITVNAETITTEEAMLSLGIGQTATDADALDFGFYGTYDVGDTQKFRGVFADASASGKFKFFKDLEVEPTTTVNTGGTGFALADVKAATFEGNLTGNVTGNVTGNLTGNATGAHSGTLAGNASTATTATNVVVSANNSANETVYPLFVDGATGTQGAETDTGLTYNPSTGMLTATGFTGDLTGNASTATTAATVTSGAQSNITSLGTLTSLTGGTGDLAWDTDTLFVDSSADRVGMGNSSPETTLHVSYNKTTTGPLGTAQLLVEPTATTGQDALIEVRGARNSSTTAVPASIKLTNYDNDLTDTNTLGAVVGKVTNHSTNVGSLILQTSADGSALSDRLTITSAGNVGIGTTSPATKLHVNGNMLLGSTFDKPTGSTFDAADAQLILGGAFNAEFNTGSNKAHLLISSHDNDDGTALYPIFVQDENVGNNSGADAITGADFFIKNRQSSSGDSTAYFGGKVGIGTISPAFPLEVNGFISTASGIVHTGDTNNTISFGTDTQSFNTTGSTRMHITSTGNVGIGTTAPDQKLHVEGSILADAYNFATTTLASNYTDGETSLVLTDASQFPTAGSGTIVDSSEGEAVEFTWTGKSSNTLTVPDLDNNYTAGVTVVADTGLFFRDGFENVAQPSVTIYDRANNGASRDDLSINANSGIRFRLSNESQMQLTADQLSLTTGNQGAAAIFGFRDRADMGIKSNTSYSVGVMAPDNVFIQTDSNNNGNANYIDFGHGSSTVGSATSMMRIVMAGATGAGKVGIGTTSPNQPLTVEGTMSLKEQASANSDTAAYGQLWVKTATPNELYFTTDAGDDIQITSGTSLAGGSGGSGDIEGVTAGTGISGGGTTGTVTVNLDIDGLTDIGGSLALDDKIPVYNLDATVVRKMDVSRLNGVLSELNIRDARNEGSTTSSEMLPADFSHKSAVFTFTDDIASSTNAWDSVITMKGWSTNYRVWQLFSASDAGSTSVDTEPLYFRTGEEDENSGNWGARREVLTFPGTTPNADGSANQILQTNGSGTLSWADISAAPSGFTVTGTQTITGTGVYNGPTLKVNNTSDSTFVHSAQFIAANIDSGDTNLIVVGQDGSNNDAAWFGFKKKSASDGSADNILTMGLWNADHLITANGNGNIGIGGNETPSHTLHALAENCQIIAEDGSSGIKTGVKSGDNAGNIGTFTNSTLNILTNDTARIHVATDGDIGVGTTSPSFASGSGIEISNATQANLRLTDSNGGSTDFAVQGNDAYILNRHASGKIIIKPGNGDHSIELASSGQVKFNNAYTFPTSDGGANQVLTTNGSGALSFADAGGSSGSDMKKFVAIQNTGTGDATTQINVNQTTAQTITWLSEISKDSIFTHSTSTNPGEITVTSDGTYMIDYSIHTDNTGSNRFTGHAHVFVNGTPLNYTLGTSYSRGSSFGDEMVAHWSGAVELSANDVVTVRMKKDHADQTNVVRVQQDGTYISLLKVGGQATNTFVIVGEESDDYVSSEAAAGNANGFIMSYGNGAQNTTKSSSGSDFGVVIPAGCTLSRIDITFGNKGSETNSSNQTLTVFKNRSASTTTMTYNASGSGGNAFVKSFSSLSGDGLSYAAGDTFNIRATGLAGYTDTQVGPARMTAYFTVD